MKRSRWLAAVAALGLVATGCSSEGTPKRVRAYAQDGRLVGEWTTHSHIRNYSWAGDYYFRDDATGGRVIVAGRVVIEELGR